MAPPSGYEVNLTAANSTLPDTTCHLLKCPPEIIEMISKSLGQNMASRLAFAATCRDVRSLVESDVYRENVEDHDGSAMVWAARNNSPGTLEKVIKAEGEGFDTSRWPLLHISAVHGSDKVMKYLLKSGVDIHREVEGLCDCAAPCVLPGHEQQPRTLEPIEGQGIPAGRTALHLAICCGRSSTAQLLMDSGALEGNNHPLLPRQVAMRTAATFGHHELFERILRGVTNVSSIIRAILRPVGEPRQTLTITDYGVLYFAIGSQSNTETLDALVKLGADINEPSHIGDPWGPSLMEQACGLRSWRMASALLDYGAIPRRFDGVEGLNKILVTLLAQIIVYQEPGPSGLERLNDAMAFARNLVSKGANFYRGGYVHVRKSVQVGLDESDGSKKVIYPCGLTYMAHKCRENDYAPVIIRFLLEMGASKHELDSGGGKTALSILVEAFDICYERDYEAMVEEEFHRGLDLYSDQIQVWGKERRLFAGIEALLERGASPTDRVVASLGIRSKTILNLAQERFRLQKHVYTGHRAARQGVNALKLARLFLRYADSSRLPQETRRSLKKWIADATRALRKTAPVTDLSVANADWGWEFPEDQEWESYYPRPLYNFEDVFYAPQGPPTEAEMHPYYQRKVFLLPWYRDDIVRPWDEPMQQEGKDEYVEHNDHKHDDNVNEAEDDVDIDDWRRNRKEYWLSDDEEEYDDNDSYEYENDGDEDAEDEEDDGEDDQEDNEEEDIDEEEEDSEGALEGEQNENEEAEVGIEQEHEQDTDTEQEEEEDETEDEDIDNDRDSDPDYEP